jgi:MipA family protein
MIEYKTKCLLSGLVVATLMSSAAIADNFSVGVGIGHKNKEYRGIDYETDIIPIIRYDSKWLSVSGPNVYLNLYQNQNLKAALKASYAFSEGYDEEDAEDSNILQGMKTRKEGGWIGPSLVWKTDYLKLSSELQFDIINSNDAIKGRVELSKEWNITRNFSLTPEVAINWYDENYIDYYYGVADSETLPERFYYKGESSISTEVALTGRYLLTPNHIFHLSYSVTFLGDEITDSPLVDRDMQSVVNFYYLYRF